MTGRLSGQVVIVTGSSSGIGRAIALGAAEEGALVVCSDLRKSADPAGYEADIETDTDDLIQNMGGTAMFVPADVSQRAEVQALVDAAVQTHGRLDVMVNNAGVFPGLRSIVHETEEMFDRTMAVNAKGVWLACKIAITQMLTQEVTGRCRGRIVNIASVAGINGMSVTPAYCASKAATANLTRQLAVDFARKRINVNAVCPGFLQTAMGRPFYDSGSLTKALEEQTPWPELGTATDIARAALFLASDDAAWVTGSMLVVDGGFSAS